MEIKIDLPADAFNAALGEDDLEARTCELAPLKRLHEHETTRVLGLDERRQLLKRTEAVLITATEKPFAKIKDELGPAIGKSASGGGRCSGGRED